MQASFRTFHSPLGWATVTLTLALSGCDMLGIETASQESARKLAEGKAIGSACRHAVRSIEDCYRNNPKAGKSAVFEGWREMDEYMRENKIEGMPFEKPVTGGMITEIETHSTGGKAATPAPPPAPETKDKPGKVDLPPRPSVVIKP